MQHWKGAEDPFSYIKGLNFSQKGNGGLFLANSFWKLFILEKSLSLQGIKKQCQSGAKSAFIALYNISEGPR